MKLKSSLKKSRFHNSYVDSHTQVKKATRVEAINPIKKITNDTIYSSENQLIYYEAYYDSLKELKREYKRFYKDEQSLEKAIKSVEANRDQIISRLKDLIRKYNKAIVSLSNFDKGFKTNNVSSIINVLKKYERSLNSIGIYFFNDIELTIKNNNIKSLSKSSSTFLFGADGLLSNLYNAFRNIKIPKKNYLESFLDPNYKGTILDDKS